MILTETQNKEVAKLYAIRAGVSQVSIEKDAVDTLEAACAKAIKEIETKRKSWQNSLNSNQSSLSYHREAKQQAENKRDEAKKGLLLWGILTLLSLVVTVALLLLEVKICQRQLVTSDARYPLMFFVLPVAALIFFLLFIRCACRFFRNNGDLRRYDTRFNEETHNIQVTESIIQNLRTNAPNFNNLISKENERFKEQAEPHYVRAKATYDGLLANYGDFLDVDDWKNVDLLIFAFISGRADTMQKAFEYVDAERRTERITSTMERATQKISSVFQEGFGSLRVCLNSAFQQLSSQITSGINEMLQSSQRQSEQLEKIRTSIDYGNALLMKQNITMEIMSLEAKSISESAGYISENVRTGRR